MSQKWRAVITVSLDGDEGSYVRHEVDEAVSKAGFRKTGEQTGTWECVGATAGSAAVALRQALDILAKDGAALDHLWIYVSKAT